MGDTEIKGIYQGDIVVRTAIIRAMDLVRDTPDLLDSVFESLVEDELTNDVYGQKQVALARHWFMNTQIPVLMNFRASEEAIPCVTIALQESQEADQTHGDVHYIPQEKSQGGLAHRRRSVQPGRLLGHLGNHDSAPERDVEPPLSLLGCSS